MPYMERRRNNEHWVWFDCRKMFRKPSRWQGVRLGDKPPIPNHECPECKKPMRDMGVYFEPPRRNAVRMWEIMRLVADNGMSFHSEGSKAYVEGFIFEMRNREGLKEQRPNLNSVNNRLIANRKWRSNSGQELLTKIAEKSASRSGSKTAR